VRYALILIASQRLWPIHYAWAPVLRLSCLAIGTVIIGLLFPNRPLALAVVTRIGLFAVYVWLASKLPILSAEDRLTVRRLTAAGLEAIVAVLKRDPVVTTP
jgi:hypothetical protein